MKQEVIKTMNLVIIALIILVIGLYLFITS